MSEPMTAQELADARALVDACPAGPWHWVCNPEMRWVGIEASSWGAFGIWFETVVDFARWGMKSAAPRFRRFDPTADEPGEMVRADLGSVPIPGREHHADWARTIVHPVGRLMVEARTIIPELLDEIARLRAEIDRLQAAPEPASPAEPKDVGLRHFVLRADNLPWDGVGFDIRSDATRAEIEAEAFQWAAEHVDYAIAELTRDEVGTDATGEAGDFDWKGADET